VRIPNRQSETDLFAMMAECLAAIRAICRAPHLPGRGGGERATCSTVEPSRSAVAAEAGWGEWPTGADGIDRVIVADLATRFGGYPRRVGYPASAGDRRLIAEQAQTQPAA
jgi:hypothetical protein